MAKSALSRHSDSHGRSWTCEGPSHCATRGSRAREQAAVDLLIAHLRAKGHIAEWQCSPEGVMCPSGMTMDAVVSVDGVPWMIDHTRLTWDDRVVPWIAEARAFLERELEVVAARVHARVVLQCPRIDGDKMGARKQQLAEVLAWAVEAAADFEAGTLEAMLWRPHPRGGGVQFIPMDEEAMAVTSPPVDMAFSMALTSNLAEQFAVANWPVIERKLDVQLRKGLGRPSKAGLLIDQVEEEIRGYPVTNQILRASSIRGALTDHLADRRDVLDAAWLIGPTGEVEQVWAGA